MLFKLKENAALMETFKRFVEKKLNRYKDIDYVYTLLSKKNPSIFLMISSYPDEWIHLYQANNIQNIDPIILSAFHRTSPFSWDEDITLISDLKLKKIFQTSRKHSIVNGYTFILHDHDNNLSLLSLIIDNNKSDYDENIKNEWCHVQMQLIEINDQMHKLKSRTVANSNPRINISNIFTTRENEVMYWISKGKCYSDIAEIIGISLSTVKFHVKNVVNKLGVNNARQAISLSVELNLINKIH